MAPPSGPWRIALDALAIRLRQNDASEVATMATVDPVVQVRMHMDALEDDSSLGQSDP